MLDSLRKTLFRHDSPRFGQLATWILLAISLVLALLPYQQAAEGVRRAEPATLVSMLDPEVVGARWFYEVIRWLLIISAVGWMFRLKIPWTCWGTCITFTMLTALRAENSNSASYAFTLANILLVVHALWFQFYYQAIAAATKAGAYRKTLLYPRWVFLLSVFCIGLVHSQWSVVTLASNNFDWGNGLSLQLWNQLFGWNASPVGSSIASNRMLATSLHVATVTITLVSPLAVLSRTFRLLVGLSLLFIYSCAFITFPDVNLQFNALILALFFLPFQSWLSNRNR